MKKILFLLFSVSLFMTNCKAQKTMNYTYADGNNNRYHISTKKISYKPIKPEESSSGTYDGGEAKTVEISKEDFNNVSILLDNMLQNPKFQNNKRQMGSSRISKRENDKSISCIIPYRSEQKSELEKLLKSILDQ